MRYKVVIHVGDVRADEAEVPPSPAVESAPDIRFWMHCTCHRPGATGCGTCSKFFCKHHIGDCEAHSELTQLFAPSSASTSAEKPTFAIAYLSLLLSSQQISPDPPRVSEEYLWNLSRNQLGQDAGC